jgi:hypothetical protein
MEMLEWYVAFVMQPKSWWSYQENREIAYPAGAWAQISSTNCKMTAENQELCWIAAASI